ncbi:MAG: hypothetical protein WCT20_04080, partial [Candidatus Babeliales bacterium]
MKKIIFASFLLVASVHGQGADALTQQEDRALEQMGSEETNNKINETMETMQNLWAPISAKERADSMDAFFGLSLWFRMLPFKIAGFSKDFTKKTHAGQHLLAAIPFFTQLLFDAFDVYTAYRNNREELVELETIEHFIKHASQEEKQYIRVFVEEFAQSAPDDQAIQRVCGKEKSFL